MKLNEQHIDYIVEETTSAYLNEIFGLKQRLKNAANGFSVGRNHQKQVDTYRNGDFSKINQTLELGLSRLRDFEKYFQAHNGKDEDFINIKNDIEAYIQAVESLKTVCEFNTQNVNESLGNRMRGFMHGLKTNQNYDRDIENITDVKDVYGDIKRNYQTVLTYSKSILNCINNLKKKFATDKDFNDLLDDLQKKINYINNFVNDNLFQKPEQTVTDSINDKLNSMSEDDDWGCSDDDGEPDPYIRKGVDYLKNKTRNMLGNERYNKLRDKISKYVDEEE